MQNASSIRNAPKIMTWAELRTVIVKWLGGIVPRRSLVLELHDLWQMGAPVPGSGPGRPERRVLLPSQFAAWWAVVCKKYGEPPRWPNQTTS